MCLPTRSPCSGSRPSSAATFRRLTIVLAPKPWPSSPATSGRAVTNPPPDIRTVVVEPAYFHTVVRGLVLGESFSEVHGTPGHEAAIVNQRFAEVYFGAGSPIGHHLELPPPTDQRNTLI